MFLERRSATESAPSQAGHDERLEAAQLAHDPPHDPALAQSPHVPFLRTRTTTRTNAIAIILRIMKSMGPIMHYFLYALSSWNQMSTFGNFILANAIIFPGERGKTRDAPLVKCLATPEPRFDVTKSRLNDIGTSTLGAPSSPSRAGRRNLPLHRPTHSWAWGAAVGRRSRSRTPPQRWSTR